MGPETMAGVTLGITVDKLCLLLPLEKSHGWAGKTMALFC